MDYLVYIKLVSSFNETVNLCDQKKTVNFIIFKKLERNQIGNLHIGVYKTVNESKPKAKYMKQETMIMSLE